MIRWSDSKKDITLYRAGPDVMRYTAPSGKEYEGRTAEEAIGKYVLAEMHDQICAMWDQGHECDPDRPCEPNDHLCKNYLAKQVPWVPYTNEVLESVSLCEETGEMAGNGRCPVHGGDACLVRYDHYKRKLSAAELHEKIRLPGGPFFHELPAAEQRQWRRAVEQR